MAPSSTFADRPVKLVARCDSVTGETTQTQRTRTARSSPALATTVANTSARRRSGRGRVVSKAQLRADGFSESAITIVQARQRAAASGKPIPLPCKSSPVNSGRIAKSRISGGRADATAISTSRPNVKVKLTFKNRDKAERRDSEAKALEHIEANKQILAREFHSLVEAKLSDWADEAAVAVTQVAMRGDEAFSFNRPRNGLFCEADDYASNLVADAIYASTKAALKCQDEPMVFSIGRQVPRLDVPMSEVYDGGGYEDEEEEIEPAEDEYLEDIWERRYQEMLARKAM